MSVFRAISSQVQLLLFVVPKGHLRFARIAKTTSGRESLQTVQVIEKSSKAKYRVLSAAAAKAPPSVEMTWLIKIAGAMQNGPAIEPGRSVFVLSAS